MIKYVFCGRPPIISNVKRALNILGTHDVTRSFYFARSRIDANVDIAGEKILIFFEALGTELQHNEYHVTSVDMLRDIVVLTQDECRRLQRFVFSSSSRNTTNHTLEMIGLMALIGRLFSAEEEPPPKRKLPVEWTERLRNDTVEPAVNDEDSCVICAEGHKRTVLFIPCDHCCSCEVCARTMMEQKGECPLCREPVTDVRRIKK